MRKLDNTLTSVCFCVRNIHFFIDGFQTPELFLTQVFFYFKPMNEIWKSLSLLFPISSKKNKKVVERLKKQEGVKGGKEKQRKFENAWHFLQEGCHLWDRKDPTPQSQLIQEFSWVCCCRANIKDGLEAQSYRARAKLKLLMSSQDQLELFIFFCIEP